MKRRLNLTCLEDRLTPTFAVGAGAGGLPLVSIYSDSGSLVRSFLAYDSSFTGGVRVATADIFGDGLEEIVTSPGFGGGPHIKVFDGLTFQLVREFLAYDSSFRGGVFVAFGDVNCDGFDDIVTGAGAGGGPHVKAFSGLDNSLLTSFMAYDPTFTGGLTVAAREGQIITGAGPGGGPHVKVWEIVLNGDIPSITLTNSFFAFDPAFTGGVFVG